MLYIFEANLDHDKPIVSLGIQILSRIFEEQGKRNDLCEESTKLDGSSSQITFNSQKRLLQKAVQLYSVQTGIIPISFLIADYVRSKKTGPRSHHQIPSANGLYV